jgi:integrase
MIRPSTCGYSPKRLKVNTKEVRLAMRGTKTWTDKLLVRFLATTGLRAAESASVQWRDIDLEMRELFVRHGKGGKSNCLNCQDFISPVELSAPALPRQERQAFGHAKGTRLMLLTRQSFHGVSVWGK